MYWNRFDIVEAYYLYFCDYHHGQGSIEYKRLSKLLGYFKPGPMFNYDSLSDNGKEIYHNIVNREQNEKDWERDNANA
jgi:hypothetical protein